MAKTKISEYDSTAANNTDIDSINIAEGCAPSGINNAIRELMAHLKDMNIGSTITMLNDTEEDSDAGRANKIIFKGEQSGGEESVLGEIQVSHDGTADDQKADFLIKTNDGSDGTSPTERLRVDSTGNVNVSGSTKTTALSSLAHFDTLGLTVDDNTAYDNVGIGGGIAFRAKRNTSGTQTIFGAIDVGKESDANDSYTGSLRFYTNNNSTGVPTEHMRINALGNVGIGTSSIDVSTQAGGSGYRALQIESDEGGQLNFDHNDAGTGSTLGQINFQRAGEVVAEIEGVTDGATDSGRIAFRTQAASGALTERMRIQADGKVGMGNNAPAEELVVQGAINAECEIMMRTQGGVNCSIFTANPTADHAFGIKTNGTEHFRVGTSGTLTATDTTIGSNSDERLKKDITDFEYDLATFKKYNAKKFNWKQPQYHGDRTNQIGFIAQELNDVDSQWVSTSTLASVNLEEVLYIETDLDIPEGKKVGDVRTEKLSEHPEAQYLDEDLSVFTAKLGQTDAMYISVIQQLISKIETLETKVAALEG